MAWFGGIHKGLVGAILLTLALPTLAQAPRETLSNLQVFPKDIAPEKLRAAMGEFTRALGVRCIHCHVGEENKPFKSWAFASDDKPAKAKARDMMRMTEDINDRFLKALKGRAVPPVSVACATCHRGITLPRPLADEVKLAYDASGIEPAMARYRALRERHHGSAAFDFGEVPLANLATQLFVEGRSQDAVRLGALNVEMNPNSQFAKRQHAKAALAQAFAQGDEVARTTIHRELKSAYGPKVISEALLNDVGYQLLAAAKIDAALAAFKLNTAENPTSANAFDSLGEGYEKSGAWELALEAYAKSLALDATNAHAQERIKQIKASSPKARLKP